jgi:iron complex outermembrane receptor protein
LPYAPQVQGDLRFRYDWQGPGALKYWVSGGGTYTGPTYNQPATYPSGEGVLIPTTTLLRYRMGGYALLDAQIGVRRDNWSASIFGDNITNSHASTFTNSVQFIKSEVVVRPMTYGVKYTFDF